MNSYHINSYQLNSYQWPAFDSLSAEFAPQVLASPAKVNLRLKVCGRRDDGFHLLSMINCLVDFSDQVELCLTPQAGIQIEVSWLGEGGSVADPALSDASVNHAARAAAKFFEHYQIPFGLKIEIRKRIPIGAGLGGGSGNAAVVLKYLRDFFSRFDKRVTASEVTSLASEIGSDVPYMIDGGLGMVTGVGEQVAPIPSAQLSGTPLWLILPQFGIATADVFAQLRKIDRQSFVADPLSGEDLLRLSREGINRLQLASLVENDLLPFAIEVRAEVEGILTRLRGLPDLIVSMSGSGSTLFALAASAQARDVFSNLKKTLSDQPVCIVETVIL